MTVGVHYSGGSPVVSAPLRYQSQSSRLTLTERGKDNSDNDGGNLVTVDDILGDAFRYRITVEGTGIEEYYEYPEAKSEGYVADDWLSDVREQWGDVMADNFQGDVEVDKLWQDQTQDDSEESATPLPPPGEEAQE